MQPEPDRSRADPGRAHGRRTGALLAGLAASAVALALAPALMPASYSPLAHTTSESAAQGVAGAWLARLGFLVFGLTVLGQVAHVGRRWGFWASSLHAAFGVLMIAAGVFSARPWTLQAAFDPTEDLLHSVAATGMGFAFAIGVTLTAVEGARSGSRRITGDVTAVVASVAIPIGMTLLPDLDGLLQRGMFLVAYAWYAAELWRSRRSPPRRRPATSRP